MGKHFAIVVVTHDHRMVENFDRILQVSDGRLSDEVRLIRQTDQQHIASLIEPQRLTSSAQVNNM